MSGKLGNAPTEALFENIEKIEVLDDSHIVIHLSEPDSSFYLLYERSYSS